MPDDAAPSVSLASHSEIDSSTLTQEERRLIQNYRKVKAAAQVMLIDQSEHWLTALPAERPQLRLIRLAD